MMTSDPKKNRRVCEGCMVHEMIGDGLRNQLRSHRWQFLAIIGMAFLFYGQPLFSSRASIQWDTVDIHYTALKYLSESLHRGEIPTWTPRIFCGYPFVADPQVGIFYPINFFLTWLLSLTPRHVQWQMLFHLLLAGVGMYLLGYKLAREKMGALIAALAYMLCGFFVGHASHLGMHNTAAWLPILILMVIQACRSRKWLWWTLLGCIVTGNMILAGHFQTALYILFVVIVVWIWEMIYPVVVLKIRSRINWKQILPAVPIMIAGGVILSAVQILPTAELVMNSPRAELPLEVSIQGSLTGESFYNFLAPNLTGVVTGFPYVGRTWREQSYLYIGVLPLLLALLGICAGWRGYSLIWILLLGMSALHALGPNSFVHKLFFDYVPGFNKVRMPANFMLVAYFSMALLAMEGFRALQQRETRKRTGVLGVLILAAMVSLAHIRGYDIAHRILPNLFHDHPETLARGVLDIRVAQFWLWSQIVLTTWIGAVYLNQGLKNLILHGRRAGHQARFLIQGRDWLVGGSICLALITVGWVTGGLIALESMAGKVPLDITPDELSIIIAGGGLIFVLGCVLVNSMLRHASSRGSLGKRVPWILVGVIFIDLFVNGSLMNHLLFARRSFDEFYYGDRSREVIMTIKQRIRKTERVHYANFGYALGPLNHAYLHGFNTTYGHNPLTIKWYADLAKGAETFQTTFAKNEKLLDLMNVRFVIREEESGGRRPIPVLEPRSSLGEKVFFARRLRVVSSEAESLKGLETLDPTWETLVSADEGLTSIPRPVESRTELLTYEDDRIVVEATSGSGGLLVFAEVFYPGWRATIDGQPARIYRVDYALRGILIPQGDHRVEMVYVPKWFYVGAGTSVLALLICCVGLATATWRYKRRAA